MASPHLFTSLALSFHRSIVPSSHRSLLNSLHSSARSVTFLVYNLLGQFALAFHQKTVFNCFFASFRRRCNATTTNSRWQCCSSAEPSSKITHSVENSKGKMKKCLGGALRAFSLSAVWRLGFSVCPSGVWPAAVQRSGFRVRRSVSPQLFYFYRLIVPSFFRSLNLL